MNVIKKYLLLGAVLFASSANAAEAELAATQACATMQNEGVQEMTPEAKKLVALISEVLNSVKPTTGKRAGLGVAREVVKIVATIVLLLSTEIAIDKGWLQYVPAYILSAATPLPLLLNDLGDELRFAPKNQTVASFTALQKYVESLTPKQRACLASVFKDHAKALNNKLATDNDGTGVKIGRWSVGIIDATLAILACAYAVLYIVNIDKHDNPIKLITESLKTWDNPLHNAEKIRAISSMFVVIAELVLLGKNLYFTADRKKANALKQIEALLAVK